MTESESKGSTLDNISENIDPQVLKFKKKLHQPLLPMDFQQNIRNPLREIERLGTNSLRHQTQSSNRVRKILAELVAQEMGTDSQRDPTSNEHSLRSC